MVKRLVVHTGNPQTLLDVMHELGKSFYCKTGQSNYKVMYFATSREVHFEGELDEKQLEKVKTGSVEVKSIKVDEFNNEIIIEE